MPMDVDLGVQLESAVGRGDQPEITRIAGAIDNYVFDDNTFSPLLFTKMMLIMGSPQFLKLDNSIRIIKIFDYHLAYLNSGQKEQLFRVLEEILPNVKDNLSGFLAVELIAELWRDERSLLAFQQLTKTAKNEATIALIVHGLDWLAKKTESTKVRNHCAEELHKMAVHESGLVKGEAKAALRRRVRCTDR
jgi:hypothetical protein